VRKIFCVNQLEENPDKVVSLRIAELPPENKIKREFLFLLVEMSFYERFFE
jgi:hypothetical protein